jgi:hypothetical protein
MHREKSAEKRFWSAATCRRFGTLFEGDLKNIGELSCYQSGDKSPHSKIRAPLLVFQEPAKGCTGQGVTLGQFY